MDLSGSISELRKIRGNLSNFRANLNIDWRGDEMAYINRAIDTICSELSNLTSSLEALKGDIDYTADEIRREDEARAAAEAEAVAVAAAKAAQLVIKNYM